MKYNLDAVLVVEGKEDVSYLSSFINGLFFVTNGSDINKNKIDFLYEVSKVRKLIILTDNDLAGHTIKNKIMNQINGCFALEISGKSRKNYKKNGVAESNKNELIKLLSPYFINGDIQLVNYELNKYISLNDNSSEIKNKIVDKYRLIFGNIKFMEKQLNMLKISKEELLKFIRE